MSEPASSAAGGVALWKALGGLTSILGLVAAVAAFFASVVAMCAMTPRHPKEWAVGIISTVFTALGGGAFAALKLELLKDLPQHDPTQMVMVLATIGGLMFVCGLPAWALVRAGFTWLERRSGMDLGELWNEARKDAGKAIAP